MKPGVFERGLRAMLHAALCLGLALAAGGGADAATGKKAARGAKKKAPAAVASAASAASTPEAPLGYGRRDDVLRFTSEVAERQGLDAGWMLDALDAARFQPAVTRFIMPPPAGTAKDWAAYRARFVEPRRIKAGADFWRANEEWLQRAEALYGVPPEIVVGIVGVETLYGQQMGNFRAIDALATLAFDFPPGRKDRSAFFRDELEQLFVMCAGRAQRPPCDPLAQKSSFAGAMGMPQFMPSSVNRYAIDFDGDGRIDLHRSAADTIGSVAHYLAEFGWQRGMPTRYDVAVPVDTAERALLLGPDILPTFTAAQFAEHGAQLGPAAQAHEGLLALVELQNGDAAASYVAGTANFYAVTRYNWSSYYALAVIELGEAVKHQLAAVPPPKAP